MSIISKLKEKRELKELNNELCSYGIVVSDVSYSEAGAENSRIFLCLVRGMLIFLASFGAVSSLVTAFDIRFNVILVFTVTLIVSMFIAFLYYNRITFYVGYIAFFLFFTFTILNLYRYVNSGYQVVTNKLYSEYSDYYNMSIVREANVLMEDEILSVSVTMIFIAAVLSVLLNITISGYMNLFLTFLSSFPFVAIGIYIDKKPSIICLMMLLTTYITVAILGRSGHYRLPDFKISKKDFTLIRKKNIRNHSYISDGNGMLTTTLYSAVLCTLFLILTAGIFYGNFNAGARQSLVKNTTDEWIKMYLQNGFWGFLDSYSSTGGLSEGKLGGVASVRPDYKTDMTVTFVPVNNDSVYLRSYIGTNYTYNEFTTDIDAFREAYARDDITHYSDLYSLSDHIPVSLGEAKMDVLNVDAAFNYQYMPYYSFDATDIKQTDEGMLSHISYIPFYKAETYTTDTPPSDEYEENVYEQYLGVPQYLVEDALYDFSYDAELTELAKQLKAADNDADRRELTLKICDRLKAYFYSEYSYTMSPGSTPRNSDFVVFFLNEQKRGYCAHFASSSTLILRYLGIPSRYVEGYVMTLSNIVDGTPVSDDTSDYITDDLNPPFETGVVSVDVTDGNAHAWTEVYLDGYGWIPYDFTPPSLETDLPGGGIADLFSGFIFSTPNMQTQATNATDNTNAINADNFILNIGSTFSFIVIPLLIITGIVIILILISKTALSIKIRFIVRKAMRESRYNDALSAYYTLFYRYASRKLSLIDPITATELADILENNNVIDVQIKEALINSINQALYGNNIISEDECQSAMESMKKIIKALRALKHS